MQLSYTELSIGSNAFQNCPVTFLDVKRPILTESSSPGWNNIALIKFTNSIKIIKADTFANCKITNITIDFLTDKIEAGAFRSCILLEKIVFEDNITIKTNAFSSNVITSEKVSVAFFGCQGSCPATTARTFSQLNSINTTLIFSDTIICGLKSNRNPYILPKYKCIIRNQYVTLAHELNFGRSIFHSLAQTYSIYSMLLGT